MTPREMNAAVKGWGRKERVRHVTMAQAFGADLSEREAKKIIEGEGSGTLSREEQEQKLEELKQRMGENE